MKTRKRHKCPKCGKVAMVKCMYGVKRYQCEECGAVAVRQR